MYLQTFVKYCPLVDHSVTFSAISFFFFFFAYIIGDGSNYNNSGNYQAGWSFEACAGLGGSSGAPQDRMFACDNIQGALLLGLLKTQVFHTAV